MVSAATMLALYLFPGMMVGVRSGGIGVISMPWILYVRFNCSPVSRTVITGGMLSGTVRGVYLESQASSISKDKNANAEWRCRENII